MSALGRAYDRRAATAFTGAREDLLEKPARDAPSPKRYARGEVVDEAPRNRPRLSLRSGKSVAWRSAFDRLRLHAVRRAADLRPSTRVRPQQSTGEPVRSRRRSGARWGSA